MAKQKREFSDEALELIAGRFRVLAEPMRLKLLQAMGNGEMTVTELIAATGSGQANVSKHLGLMWKEGLIARRKEGLNTFYKVADERLFDLFESVRASLGDFLAAQHGAVRKATRR